MELMEEKMASCLGVRDGFIRRNARMSVARPMDMPGVLAAEVAKLLSAEEERRNRQARRRPVEGEKDQASTTRKRNARMSVARPMDMGIEPGVLAAEVAMFLSAEEERTNQALRRPIVEGEEDGASTMRKRDAGISVAMPVYADMLAAEVPEFVAVAAAERQRTCQSEDGRTMVRRARISVAGPVDLGIDPVWLAAEVAESRVAAERRQARLEAARAARHARHADKAGPGRRRRVTRCI